MRQDPLSFSYQRDYGLQMWAKPVGPSMDELKLRRMKRCAENPEGHIFGDPVDHVVECTNCGLAIEELEHILGADQ